MISLIESLLTNDVLMAFYAGLTTGALISKSVVYVLKAKAEEFVGQSSTNNSSD